MTPPLNDSRDDWAVFADMLAARGDVRGEGINVGLAATLNDVAAVWLPLCIDAYQCRFDGYRCAPCEARVSRERGRRAWWGNLAQLPHATVLARRSGLRSSLGGRRRHGRAPRPVYMNAPDLGAYASCVVTFNTDGSLDAFTLDINARLPPF